jgi:hypothetical protein
MKPIEDMNQYEVEETLDAILVNMSRDHLRRSQGVREFVGRNYQRYIDHLEEIGREAVAERYRKHWERVTGYEL